MPEQTDREVLLDMLKRAGIEPIKVDEVEIVIQNGHDWPVTVFSFRPSGGLDIVSAWE